MSSSTSLTDTRLMSVDSAKAPAKRRDVIIPDEELLELGYIGKAHGLGGEVRLSLHNPDGETLDCIERLVVRQRGGAPHMLRLLSIRGGTNPVLVAFEGVSSREEAERLRGSTAFAFRSDLPPLEPGEYYLSDLVGARVVGPDGEVGVVAELALYPTVDALVIRDAAGKRLEQPLAEPWIESVDSEAKLVRLRTLDGLIE